MGVHSRILNFFIFFEKLLSTIYQNFKSINYNVNLTPTLFIDLADVGSVFVFGFL